MFEIGLGCDTYCGTVRGLWRSLSPRAELREAERNTTCLERSTKTGALDGGNVLVGNQKMNALEVRGSTSRFGEFDPIIDGGADCGRRSGRGDCTICFAENL